MYNYDGMIGPKYFRIKQDLVNKLESGFYKPSDKIPSERELVEEYGVSRITVRRAISELIEEGLLYTIQGKGTFVKDNSHDLDLVKLTSCTEDLVRLGYTPSRKVIKHQILSTDETRKQLLDLYENEKVFHLSRVYYADDQTVNYTSAYLPYKYFIGIEKWDFSKHSLYEILENEYGIRPVRSHRTIEAVFPSEEVAKHLEMEKETPILLFKGVTYGYINGILKPIEAYKSWYRSDRFAFYIEQIT